MITWETVKRFFEPVLQDKITYGISILISFMIFGFEVYSIVILQLVTKSIEQNNIEQIKYYLSAYIISYIIYATIKRKTRNLTWISIGRINEKYISKKYLKYILTAENTQIEKMGTGRITAIFKEGALTRRQSLEAVARFIPEILISIGFVVFSLSSLHRSFGILFLLIVYGIFLISNHINSFVLSTRKKKKDCDVEIARRTVRYLMSKQEIISSNKLNQELSEYNNHIHTRYIYAEKTNIYLRRLYEIPIRISQILIICIIGYAILGIQGGYFELSLFVGLIGARGYISKSIIKFMSRFKDFTTDFAHIEKLWELYDTLQPIQGYDTGSTLALTHGSIALSHISYSYNPNNLIFSDFSLSLQAKKKTALVGPSGGGKSTLIKLIAGYLRPDAGDIIIDGQSIVHGHAKSVSLQSYYKHIGYLTQEPSVFDGTVRENLEYGMILSHPHPLLSPSPSERVTAQSIVSTHSPLSEGEGVGGEDNQAKEKRDNEEKLHAIIQLAKCERIYDLPQGLDTEIGERGVRLSGGQKQRLAIAKIMLKNPEIILLDEPTSALDSYNEEQVTIALNNLFKDKTVVVIAHRLQTVKHADEIIYIGHRDALYASDHIPHSNTSTNTTSQILERGTHEELLAKKGEYYKMVELQSGF